MRPVSFSRLGRAEAIHAPLVAPPPEVRIVLVTPNDEEPEDERGLIAIRLAYDPTPRSGSPEALAHPRRPGFEGPVPAVAAAPPEVVVEGPEGAARVASASAPGAPSPALREPPVPRVPREPELSEAARVPEAGRLADNPGLVWRSQKRQPSEFSMSKLNAEYGND